MSFFVLSIIIQTKQNASKDIKPPNKSDSGFKPEIRNAIKTPGIAINVTSNKHKRITINFINADSPKSFSFRIKNLENFFILYSSKKVLESYYIMLHVKKQILRG